MPKAQSGLARSQNAWEGWISMIRMDEKKRKNNGEVLATRWTRNRYARGNTF